MTPQLQARIDKVRDEVDIVDVVAKAGVRLSKGRNPRGKCPFHGSKSDSFAVYPDKGIAKCWGCPWAGDVIRFVSDHYGLTFGDALKRLEEGAGIDGLDAAPLRTRKQARAVSDRPHVDSVVAGRYIWKTATHRPDVVRIYLAARGVPASMLSDQRLADIRFHALAPLSTWPEDLAEPERDAPKAPALCALIRTPVLVGDRIVFEPIGLHVTYLAPSLDAKMVRRKGNGDLYDDRKMMGKSKRGCVVLGPTATATASATGIEIVSRAPLFVGEGIETVLSGMALAGADDVSTGLATLSLGNLEGKPRLWKGGVWPLFDMRAGDDDDQGVYFRHLGPVTGLIDADMKPLRGPRDPRSGEFQGLPVVEARGGPIVQRPITTAERAAICATLFAKNWRGAGCRHVSAVRPRMGLDFNDAIREGS